MVTKSVVRIGGPGCSGTLKGTRAKRVTGPEYIVSSDNIFPVLTDETLIIETIKYIFFGSFNK